MTSCPGSNRRPGKGWKNDAINRGLNLIAKGSDYYYFSISFGLSKKELRRFADSQRAVQIRCYQLMKKFAEDFWFVGDDKPLVDSYKLKVYTHEIHRFRALFSHVS
jgi:hypothetical protein